MSRPERVGKRIREEVSEILHEDVSDPRIGFVSITQVDVSPDLENARIGVSILGDENQKRESMQGLNSATSFIRGKLGNMLELRIVPEIKFVRDDSLEKGSQVLSIMSKLEKEEHERSSRHKKGRTRR
ncbi:30S ribosome-binding factor RbfA [Candidatus Margulisiibacteriota bacterium]